MDTTSYKMGSEEKLWFPHYNLVAVEEEKFVWLCTISPDFVCPEAFGASY